MKKIYFYFHAGSGNHGCEAIVRATQSLLDTKAILISENPEEDSRYQIDQITELHSKPKLNQSFLEKIGCAFTSRILKSEKYGYHVRAKHEAEEFEPGSLALSIGGDNYCYGEAYNVYLAEMNKELHKRGIKTVLWGCSIEPGQITEAMERDFARYNLIVARETLSYNVLKKYNRNTILASDPAFSLGKKELPLPDNFITGKTVGINLSPLIQKSETISGITLMNYQNMIQYILEYTDYSIALIPHVVCKGNDDRKPLKCLFDEFKSSGRVCMIEDYDCTQLKGFISKCVLFIGARTHATIAAYSTGIPTLVIGYSNKALGIARDLFGTEENYVLPVQKLRNPDDMVNAFCWLDANKSEISKKLVALIPEYSATIKKAVEAISGL